MSDQTMYVQTQHLALRVAPPWQQAYRKATPAELVAAFRRLATCPTCQGTGWFPSPKEGRGDTEQVMSPDPCPECGGTGLTEGIEAAAELAGISVDTVTMFLDAFLDDIGGQKQ